MSAAFNSVAALATGITVAFYFSWRLACVALGCVPIMIIGSMIDMTVQFGASDKVDPMLKDVNKMAGDSIINYKTVASFGQTEEFIKTFAAALAGPTKKKVRMSSLQGFTWGFSQFNTYGVFATLFYFSAYFDMKYGAEGANAFKALFSLMYGAFQIGMAQTQVPDAAKAQKSAQVIFKIVDKKSRINAVDQPSIQN